MADENAVLMYKGRPLMRKDNLSIMAPWLTVTS